MIFGMLGFMLLLTYAGGVLNVFSSNDYVVHYTGDTSKQNVSLMINVYWGTEFILSMLDVFDKYNIKTTFFIGGSWAMKNNEILIEMHNRGHEIGNHGFNHKDHKQLSFERNEEEIYTTHKLVKSILDIDMTLFAPPSGAFSENTLKVARNLGYETIMWNKDTVDWKIKDKQTIYERAVKKPHGGDLILMHPTEASLAALEDIIDFYLKKGFNLTTVSENISL
jgi:peptidoglycan/xylan/chitin deacetylase (PgdA/CDA1 family)